MKLYIDDCRLDVLEKMFDIYPIDGVTSNPTVLKKCGRNPVEALTEVRKFIGPDKMLMSQVISTNADDMIREAHRLVEIIGDGEYFVKLPANEQGIKAIKTLSAEGIRTNATGIYTVTQGLIAAHAGAGALAPYVNRVDNLGGDGLQMTHDIQDILDANGYSAVIVPGSIKSVRQVIDCAKYGIYGVAIAADVFDQFLKNPTVDDAIRVFNSDFEDLTGTGKTFLDM